MKVHKKTPMLHVSNSKILHHLPTAVNKEGQFRELPGFFQGGGDLGSNLIPFGKFEACRWTAITQSRPNGSGGGGCWLPGSPTCCEVDVTWRWSPSWAGGQRSALRHCLRRSPPPLLTRTLQVIFGPIFQPSSGIVGVFERLKWRTRTEMKRIVPVWHHNGERGETEQMRRRRRKGGVRLSWSVVNRTSWADCCSQASPSWRVGPAPTRPPLLLAWRPAVRSPAGLRSGVWWGGRRRWRRGPPKGEGGWLQLGLQKK